MSRENVSRLSIENVSRFSIENAHRLSRENVNRLSTDARSINSRKISYAVGTRSSINSRKVSFTIRELPRATPPKMEGRRQRGQPGRRREEEEGEGRSSERPRALEVCLGAAVLLVVWALYCLPIIALGIAQVKEHTITPTREPAPVDTPTATPTCADNPALYTGQICRQELLQRQNCLSEGSALLPNEEEVYILSANQSIIEETAEMLARDLSVLDPSSECEVAFRSFLCVQMFGLCSSRGSEVMVTQEECTEVSTVLCPREWEVARQYLGDIQLPVCASLPQGGREGCKDSEAHNEVTTQREGGRSNQADCGSDVGVYMEDGLCTLECEALVVGSQHRSSQAVQTAMALLGALCIICTAVVVALSCTVQQQSMLKFPNFCVILMCFTNSILAMCVLMSYANRTLLFCGEKRSIATVNGMNMESVFCTITGLFYVYSTLQWSILAAIYCTVSYWKQTHPNAYQRASVMKNKVKLVTLVCFGLSVVLPLVICLGHLQQGFVIQHSPTFFCSPRDTGYGYVTGFVLPSVVSALTMSVVLLYLWSVVKDKIKIKSKTPSPSIDLETVPWLSLVLIYTVFSGVANLAYHAIRITHRDILEGLSSSHAPCKTGMSDTMPCRSSLGGSGPLNAARLVLLVPVLLQPLLIAAILVSLRVYRGRERWSEEGEREGSGQGRAQIEG